MADKEAKNNNVVSKKAEEKFYYSDETIACFACGGKIDPNTKVCPYCGIKIIDNDN